MKNNKFYQVDEETFKNFIKIHELKPSDEFIWEFYNSEGKLRAYFEYGWHRGTYFIDEINKN